MYVKKHICRGKFIFAICDSDIFGKKFSDENINLTINEPFFGGELKTAKTVEKLLREADNFNLVGKKVIDLAVKCKIVDKAEIKYIKKVLFAILFGV